MTTDPPNDTIEMFPDLYSPAPPPAEVAAATGPLSEIAPGVWVSGMPEWETPTHVLCRLVPLAEPDTYRLEPEGAFPGWIRMTEDIGQRLNIVGLSETTLRRLMWAGYIEHFLGAPGCTYLSIESILNHLRNTKNDHAKDESYWTPARRLAWKATCAGGAAGR
jgi:hypothetical protein